MVSTYYLMKLFKKATNERLNRNVDNEQEISGSDTSQREDNVNKCRICLKEGTIPIYDEQDLSTEISTFGDINISKEDQYPKYICECCNRLLEAAILFRKTAKKTDTILRNRVSKQRSNLNKIQSPQSAHETQDNSSTSRSQIEEFYSVVDNEIEDLLQNRKKITKVQCRICFKIITKAYYKEHFALHDQTKTKHVCDICGRSFRQRCSYRNHYLTHRSEFPYKCQLCPYRGKYSSLLKTHMRTHTEDYRYMCTECPARFLTKSNLNKHSYKHKEPLYKCETCQKGYHSKLNLERHFEADHLGVKNHVCPTCGKAFGYRKAMMRHQLDVHKREKKSNGRTPAYLEAEMIEQEDKNFKLLDNL